MAARLCLDCPSSASGLHFYRVLLTKEQGNENPLSLDSNSRVAGHLWPNGVRKPGGMSSPSPGRNDHPNFPGRETCRRCDLWSGDFYDQFRCSILSQSPSTALTWFEIARTYFGIEAGGTALGKSANANRLDFGSHSRLLRISHRHKNSGSRSLYSSQRCCDWTWTG